MRAVVGQGDDAGLLALGMLATCAPDGCIVQPCPASIAALGLAFASPRR